MIFRNNFGLYTWMSLKSKLCDQWEASIWPIDQSQDRVTGSWRGQPPSSEWWGSEELQPLTSLDQTQPWRDQSCSSPSEVTSFSPDSQAVCVNTELSQQEYYNTKVPVLWAYLRREKEIRGLYFTLITDQLCQWPKSHHVFWSCNCLVNSAHLPW